MGLFSSKKVVTVDVGVSRVVQDIENNFPTTVLKAVLSKKRLAHTIRDDLLNGFASKAGLYYRYGRDHYSIGLPTGTQSFGTGNEAGIAAVIGSEIGEAVTLNSVVVDKAIPTYFAHAYGITNYGYSLDTNEYTIPLTAAAGRYFFVSAEFEGNQLKLNYRREVASSTHLEHILINYAGLEPSHLYYHVEYEKTADPTNKKYIWLYDPYTNVYPELTDIGGSMLSMEFMPIIPLVKNKVPLTESGKEDLIETAKKMARSIGLNTQEIIDAMMSKANGNDPSAIDDAFLMFALDITTDTEAGCRYMYEFFSSLTVASEVTETIFDAWVASGGNSSAPFNLIEIDDGEANTSLTYNYIKRIDTTGIIGPIGTFTSAIVVLPKGSGSGRNSDYERSYLSIKRQVTENTLEVIEVHGLLHTSTVYEGRLVVRTLADAKKADTSDTPDKGFYMPVSKKIADKLPWQLKSNLYLESLVIVVYAVQITKVKWYQKSIFYRIIQIILVIVAAVSQNYQLIGVATALQIAINVLISIIINLAASMVLVAAISVLVDIFGINSGLILALATVIAAAYGYLSSDTAALWVKYSANIASAAIESTTKAIQKEGRKLAEEYKNLLAEYKDAYEILESIEEDLSPEFDILLFDRPSVLQPRLMESPGDFYQRTVHLGNTGPLIFGLTEFYYDHMLQLPKVGN